MDPDVLITVVFSSFVVFVGVVVAVVVAALGKLGHRHRDPKTGRSGYPAATTGMGRSNEHA